MVKYIIIITIVVLCVSCVLFIIIRNAVRNKKIRNLQKNYPNAFRYWGGPNWKKKKHELLLHTKSEWKSKESQELNRIRILSLYNEIRTKYPYGLKAWEEEHQHTTKEVVVSNINDIKIHNQRAEELKEVSLWEKSQDEYAKLCRSKHSTIPNWGCYCYDIDFTKTNYNGRLLEGQYKVWQFFINSYCCAQDLDYSHFEQIHKNSELLDKYINGEVKYTADIVSNIFDFIKSLETPIQILTFSKGDYFNSILTSLNSKKVEYQCEHFNDITNISTNHIVVIDNLTSNTQLHERCKAIIEKFKNQRPCITYITLMKELSRAEMQKLIELKRKVNSEAKEISRALKNAQIEVAQEKLKSLKDITQSSKVDKELEELVRETESKIDEEYRVGIVDNYDIQHVDYQTPKISQELNDWKYPVVKYPKYGKLVFPFRRRSISRRGYMEEDFQRYLQNIFEGYNLDIIGDCSILYSDNCRPYEPDIAIIPKNQPSIRIDIEIDEPYTGLQRKPIHFIGCGDDFRDESLNNLGWIVIRITEHQVFSNPKGCAAFITQILHNIQPTIPLPESLLSYPTVNKEDRWTETTAMILAVEKYRENYLEHEFGETPTKQITTLDIIQTDKERECSEQVQPLIFSNITPHSATSQYKKLAPTVNERDRHIQFYPKEHIYLYDGKIQFIPVSSIVSYFFTPFNSELWSSYKAEQRGVPQGQILEEWDAKGSKSRELGTFMHKQIENFFNGVQYELEYRFNYNGKYIQNDEVCTLKEEYRQFKAFINDHQALTPYKTEWIIYDETLKIAGTIDMLHKRDNVFDIYDWKRSSRVVDFYSGEPIKINTYDEVGIRGLGHIEDTSYWHYCLQQNLYRYILEHNYNIRIEKMYLVVMIDGLDNYVKIGVPNMDAEIDIIIKECQKGNVRLEWENKLV